MAPRLRFVVLLLLAYVGRPTNGASGPRSAVGGALFAGVLVTVLLGGELEPVEAKLQLVNEDGELYPWSRHVVADAVGIGKLQAALSRPCPVKPAVAENASALTEAWAYKRGLYAAFAQRLRGSKDIQRVLGTSPPLGEFVGALLAQNSDFNPHLRICPWAVYAALKVQTLRLMLEAELVMLQIDKWNEKWHGVRHAHRAMSMFQDVLSRSPFEQSPASRQEGWLDSFNWLDSHTMAQHQYFQSDMKPTELLDAKWTGVTDQEHFELIRDSTELLNRAKQEGIIEEWTVTHGTMLTAMRYGASRAPTLPSGSNEENGNNFDMDVFISASPQKWNDFVQKLSSWARDRNFRWCGMMQGWKEYSLMCWRGQMELEMHLVQAYTTARASTEDIKHHRLLLAMLPTTLCRVDPGAGVSGDGFDVPCPRDPVAFMRYIWRQKDHYMSCLALPVGRWKEVTVLSEEDVRFLWRRSLDLHAKGYQSMANLYPDCRDHPMSDFAHSLYWSGWMEGLREYK
eukprot:TRINITY_DN55183_c0_g1_i1.p1 TRINITY_DN55183_c0_g1~~TRINITY_DN55183_c0_g1_i1.p1  ORF type:complete len:547 (-),score=113.23 TRINITY_DN55183_c0_g1_i1:18-1553(-)